MKNAFRIFFSLLFALLSSLPAGAAPPKTLSYQGVLTNNAAVPVNGAHSVVFSLYAASIGGSALWTETQSVGVTNGLFAVTPGAGTPITLPFDAPYYLGVKVGADLEMTPRQPLAASPYAFRALGLDASATVPGATVVGPISAVGAGPGNTFVGANAGNGAVTGDANVAFGGNALPVLTMGVWNTATGFNSLLKNEVGSYNAAHGLEALANNVSGSNNTAVGVRALLNSTAASNIAIGANAGASLTTGGGNIAIGHVGVAAEANTTRIGTNGSQTRAFIAGVRGITTGVADASPVGIDSAGQLGTLSAIPGSLISGPISATGVSVPGSLGFNTVVGLNAGLANTFGSFNTTMGETALFSNSVGNENSAFGSGALSNTTGSFNTGVGNDALNLNSGGNSNTAVGSLAASRIFGNNNIAIGALAGSNWKDGDNNIAIGNLGGAFLTTESNTIRIGEPTAGAFRAFIQGISGITSSGGVQVYVNSSGQLGTATSSRRFKENIAAMSDASAGLMHLHPVTFNYLDGQDDGQKLMQYGLIAEEVAEVYPGLVVKTPDGQAETVRYHFLTPMLLNEVQKQQRVIASQAARIDALEKQSLRMAALLERLESTPAAERQ